MKRRKSSPRSARQLAVTAHHEAGHAVAAVVLRRNLYAVRIVESDRGDSECVVAGSVRRPWQRERDAVISIAGPIAEQKFAGRFSHLAARYDYDDAAELVGDADEKLVPIFDAAHELVEAHWREIRAVARVLLVARRLSARQVRAIVGA